MLARIWLSLKFAAPTIDRAAAAATRPRTGCSPPRSRPRRRRRPAAPGPPPRSSPTRSSVVSAAETALSASSSCGVTAGAAYRRDDVVGLLELLVVLEHDQLVALDRARRRCRTRRRRRLPRRCRTSPTRRRRPWRARRDGERERGIGSARACAPPSVSRAAAGRPPRVSGGRNPQENSTPPRRGRQCLAASVAGSLHCTRPDVAPWAQSGVSTSTRSARGDRPPRPGACSTAEPPASAPA